MFHTLPFLLFIYFCTLLDHKVRNILSKARPLPRDSFNDLSASQTCGSSLHGRTPSKAACSETDVLTAVCLPPAGAGCRFVRTVREKCAFMTARVKMLRVILIYMSNIIFVISVSHNL